MIETKATKKQLHKQRKRLDIIEIKRNVNFMQGCIDAKKDSLGKTVYNMAKGHFESAIKLLDEIEKEFVNE